MIQHEHDHASAPAASRTETDDIAQLRLREQEERHAAAAAEDVTAREAHLGLAQLYADAIARATHAGTTDTASEPPDAGPSSDVNGVNMDARSGAPNRDVEKGTTADIANAGEQSIGRPRHSGKLALF